MDFTVETAGPCLKKVTVKIPKERVSEEFDKSYRQLTKTVPIPGFRQGKAPRKLVEKRFKEQVALDVKQQLLDAAFSEALEKNDLSPIADPDVDVADLEVDPDQGVDFDFTIAVKPEFDLPDLKGITVTVESAEPTQDEIDEALKTLRKRKATLRPLEKGAIGDGDVVTLKLEGRAGETTVLSEDALPYEVGSKHLGGLVAEDLDEALLGKKAGASVQAHAFVPPHQENHQLAGVNLDIEAEVIEVKRPDLPEVDDALAKLFDFDDKAELLKSVTDDVRGQKERQRDKAIEDAALAQLLETCDFELPEQLIEREAEDIARRAAYEMQMQNKSEGEIAAKVAELRARRSEESTREMKSFFVLDKIVEKERILVTENEVKDAVAMIAMYNQKTPEQMYALLRESGRLGTLRNQLRENKARERLRKKVEVTEGSGKAAKKKAAKKKTTKKKDDA